MLVLAVGGAGAEGAAVGRVYETLIGAAIGVAVNFAVAPPVHVRPAGDAIGQLAGRLAEFLRGLAGELRTGWSRAAAERWLDEARALGPDVARADRSVARAEQSALLNPRGDEVREAQPRLRTALTGIELLLHPAADAVPGDLRPHVLPADRTRRPRRTARRPAPPSPTCSNAPPRRCAAWPTSPRAPGRSRRPGPGCTRTWSSCTSDATGWAGCCWSTRTSTRRPGSSTARCWPPSTGCGWRSRRRYVRRPSRGARRSITEGPRQAVRRVIDAAAEDALPLITERPRQAVRRAVDAASEVAAVAAADAAANLAISDPRVQRRRAADLDSAVHADSPVPADNAVHPDSAVHAERPSAEAVSAVEAAAVAQVTAEMAAEAAAIAAASAEAAEHAEPTAPSEEPPAEGEAR